MSSPRAIRQCALQTLYQFDSIGTDDAETIRQSLGDSPGGEAAQEAGFKLAQAIWAVHDAADQEIEPLTPDWPLRRQPMIDRNLLRLAWYELRHTDTPPRVVIDEAVEIAREFSTEKSPAFVNGVLDRLFHGPASSTDETGVAVASTDPIDPIDAIDATPDVPDVPDIPLGIPEN